MYSATYLSALRFQGVERVVRHFNAAAIHIPLAKPNGFAAFVDCFERMQSRKKAEGRTMGWGPE